MMRLHLVVVLLLMAISTVSRAQDNWNAPQAPFRIFGNTYYVGTTGLQLDPHHVGRRAHPD